MGQFRPYKVSIMNWSKVLTESSVANYLPLDEKDQGSEALAEAVYNTLSANLPDGYLWESCWCDGNEASPDCANELASALLSTKRVEHHRTDLATGEWISGRIGYNFDDQVCWISWGCRCPMDVGCDEILVTSYVE